MSSAILRLVVLDSVRKQHPSVASSLQVPALTALDDELLFVTGRERNPFLTEFLLHCFIAAIEIINKSIHKNPFKIYQKKKKTTVEKDILKSSTIQNQPTKLSTFPICKGAVNPSTHRGRASLVYKLSPE